MNKKTINITLALIITICAVTLVTTVVKELKSKNKPVDNPIVETSKLEALSPERALKIAGVYEQEGYEIVLIEKMSDNNYIVEKKNTKTGNAMMTMEIDMYTGEMTVINIDHPLVTVSSK